MEEEQPPNREGRRGLMAVAILAALGLAGGAAVRMWTTGRGIGAGASGATAEEAFQSRLSPGAKRMWDRLLSELGRKDARRFTIDRLVAALYQHRDAPAAQAFAADFARDPKLIEVFERYLRSQDTLTAAWLARTLAETPAFVALLNRHAESRAFLVLVSSATDRVARGAEEGGSGSGEGEEHAHGDGHEHVAASGGAQSHKEAVPDAPPVGPSPPLITGPRPQGTTPAEAPPQAPVREEERPRERPASDVRDVTRRTTEPGEHEVEKLKEVKTVEKDMDSVQFIASMFVTMAKVNRDKLLSLCLNQEVCDPVEACDKAGIYPSCLAACNANPKCRGRIPPSPPGDGEDAPGGDGPGGDGEDGDDDDDDREDSQIVVGQAPPPPPPPPPAEDEHPAEPPKPPPPPPPPSPPPSQNPCPQGHHSHPHIHLGSGFQLHSHSHCRNNTHH